jgi:hypothetical protein
MRLYIRVPISSAPEKIVFCILNFFRCKKQEEIEALMKTPLKTRRAPPVEGLPALRPSLFLLLLITSILHGQRENLPCQGRLK